MKKLLAGIGLAFGGILILMGVGSMLETETEPEQPIIKRAVDRESESESPRPTTQPTTVKPQTAPKPSCDPSYPDVCIPPRPPDLDCDEISYSNFRVTGSDPHGLDRDNDGIGCEVGSPSEPVKSTPQTDCDPSYPTVCIPTYPPDLDCGEISYKRFKVLQPDPHGFDRDRDGIGCES